MDKNPKFSIIVPVYNVEQYLSFCIESIISQTLKDIEIICVNDGSTDSSLDILQQYAMQDDRIQIIDKKNGGLSSARNAGLDIAEGDYILFVDADDYLENNACDRLYMEILQTNTDVIVFGTKIFPLKTFSEQSWLYDVLSVEQTIYEGNCIKALFNEKASKPFVWNECYKREMLEENHLRFDESVRYGEDMIFLFALFPRIHNVVYIPDKLYAYRCERDKSLMDVARNNAKWKMYMHLRIIEIILDDWEKNDFLQDNMNEMNYWSSTFILDGLESLPLYFEQKKNIVRDFLNIRKKYNLYFTTNKKKYRNIEKNIAIYTKR